MTKVSVSFVADLSDIPALFSTLGASLSLCQELSVESIIEPRIPLEILSPADLAKDPVNHAQTTGGFSPNSKPLTPGLTREHPAKPSSERPNRQSERDYTRSRVQTIMYDHMVSEGYHTPVDYETLKVALELQGFSPKSASPGLTMLRKQGLIATNRTHAWALTPEAQRPKGGEPELPLEGTKSNG